MNDFLNFDHEFNGIKHIVYKKGKGPGIIIMHELPGMIQGCVNFARKISDAGFTVYLPLMFGEPNKNNLVSDSFKNLAQLCISKEFYLFSTGKSSPIIEWLKNLCKKSHEECGYKGVGAIGMCLTGGFAIPMLVEPSLMAPVLSQPSLPLGISNEMKNSLGCSNNDFEKACIRSIQENIPVLGFKFSHDILSPNEKFVKLKEKIGNLFIDNTIDSSPNNPHNFPLYAHSVFTLPYKDSDPEVIQKATDTLIQFFKDRLIGSSMR